MNWPRAILFDLDGTLADSAPDLADALNGLMGEEGLPVFTLDEVKIMVGGGVPKLVERALGAHGLTPDETLVTTLAGRFLEIYEPRAAEKTRLFPGALEALERYHGEGVGLGVATNKPEAVTRRILEALGVSALIGAVVGGDTLPVKKPYPAPLLEAFEKLDCAAPDGLMVGDSGVDAQAARAAGVPVVLVTFGYTQTPVNELDCDARIDSFAALPGAITGLGARAGKP